MNINELVSKNKEAARKQLEFINEIMYINDEMYQYVWLNEFTFNNGITLKKFEDNP